MQIARLNEIFINQGPEAALNAAQVNCMPSWVLEKLMNDEWDPSHSPKKAGLKGQPNAVSVRYTTPLPRIGKTARTGGPAASKARQARRSEKDRAIREAMRGN